MSLITRRQILVHLVSLISNIIPRTLGQKIEGACIREGGPLRTNTVHWYLKLGEVE